MSFCLVVAASAIYDYHRHRELLKLLPSPSAVYCADGGMRHAGSLGVSPSILLGDFDSSAPGHPTDLAATGMVIERHPPIKEFTDTEIAVDHAYRAGFCAILVFGALGGRTDHTLTNLLLVYKYAEKGVHIVLANEYGFAAVLTSAVGKLVVDRRNPPASLLRLRNNDAAMSFDKQSMNYKLSILPAGGGARGVTTGGLYYCLENADMPPCYTAGISNEFTSDTASVALIEGAVFIFVDHD